MVGFKSWGDSGAAEPPPFLTDITQLNYSFEVIVSVMKYSSHCNEGCIDLNRRALLKDPATKKEQEEWKVSSDHHSVFYQHRAAVLITNYAPQRKQCLGGNWATFIQQIRNMQPVIKGRCCSFLHHLWTSPSSNQNHAGYITATCCSESMSRFIQERIRRVPREK